MHGEGNIFASLAPFIIISLVVGIVPYYLGIKKGYKGAVWLILAFFPGLNFFTGWLFIGLPDRLLHQKIDAFIERAEKEGSNIVS